ncbi:DUF6077 domain-containing protein [Paraburkholderia xenovorans]
MNQLVAWWPVAFIVLAVFYRSLGPPAALSSLRQSAAVNDPAGAKRRCVMLGGATVVCLLTLAFSWALFWACFLAVLLVFLSTARGASSRVTLAASDEPVSFRQWVTLFGLAMLGAFWTLWISRSDLDDAFYVAVAAFAHAHPGAPVLGSDPMFGEAGWPLIFPSYRFSSFELLGGALATLLHRPAMGVMYVLLPPISAVFVVISAAHLSRELYPTRWLPVVVVTLLLMVLLGECHRGHANFAFDRLFQGKAVLVSVVLTLIYSLNWRYMREGGRRNLMLLACAQVAAVGISNFGMLIAPIAAAVAAISDWRPSNKETSKRLVCAWLMTTVSLPYLLTVAAAARGMDIPRWNEPPAHVWLTVFGARQQFLVVLLLACAVAIPIDSRVRRLMIVPPLVLMGVLLNPLFAGFVSSKITTPDVYWRVVWVFPVLPFLAVGGCALVMHVMQHRSLRDPLSALALLLCAGILMAAPLNSLRQSNQGVEWHFAKWKVKQPDLDVALAASRATGQTCRLLAPDNISGIVSGFENHPALIAVRGHYLNQLRAAMGEMEFRQRLSLYDLVSGNEPFNKTEASEALSQLRVATVVLDDALDPSGKGRALLLRDGFTLTGTYGTFRIWTSRSICRA